MRFIGLGFALLVCAFFAEEYEVRLSTHKSVFSLEFTEVEAKEADFKRDYLNQLKKVLSFDLEYSGYFSLVLSDSQQGNLFDEKKSKAAFLVRPIAAKNEFYLEFWPSYQDGASQLRTKKISKRVDLQGVLSSDRCRIHVLANDFLKQAIQKKGIFESRILYSVRTEKSLGKWLSEIWICDWDGENAHPVTFENSYCTHPIFLSRNNFLYVSYRSGFPKIYISSLDKKNSQPLISLRGNQLLPALSRDKRRVAFISDAAGRPDLFMQPLSPAFLSEQKPLQLFSFPRATQASSAFSPDGNKLAFVSDKDGTPRIYWINISENMRGRRRPEAHLITLENRGNVSPSWSLDGRKLAYSAMTAGTRQIWIYDFETKEERQLTFGGKHKENPNFSFDNLHIVYNTEDKAEAELYIIDIEQAKSVKIGRGVGRKRFPAFEQN